MTLVATRGCWGRTVVGRVLPPLSVHHHVVVDRRLEVLQKRNITITTHTIANALWLMAFFVFK